MFCSFFTKFLFSTLKSTQKYKVFIFNFKNFCVDFICEKENKRIYYQVAASVYDPNTFKREITPLKKIKDNYTKNIITLDDYSLSESGIYSINIIDFLLDDKY